MSGDGAEELFCWVWVFVCEGIRVETEVAGASRFSVLYDED